VKISRFNSCSFFTWIIDYLLGAMKSFSCKGFVLGLLVGCGVVVGHQHQEGKQVPLHEQEYVQDPVEELERKWSFEVSYDIFLLFSMFENLKSYAEVK
jgi:hypothetical protein